MQRIKIKIIMLLCCTCFLAACSHVAGINLGPYYEYGPTRNDFKICHGYSCHFQAGVRVSEDEWRTLLTPLENKSVDADAEREALGDTLARIERFVGERTGTHKDKAEAATMRDGHHQLDCIDETVNLALYLKFIDESKLLHFHGLGRSVHRGYFLNGKWPHNAFSIIEKESKKAYVIDSYYRENGAPPYIIERDQWAKGWRPESSSAPQS